ncbi:hypothetical protein B0293_26435 [Amycolatopsis azurea DSM 43854]|uniref:Uncharacterized protein n=1 Tax=Amycolatopsis azurea DSM 43854 TaxID=1238180 RepID=A0ABX3JAK9_9PSEU|nr:hypothetical protein B0293_26435 [Amycolatopsis azurea DSM 43854]
MKTANEGLTDEFAAMLEELRVLAARAYRLESAGSLHDAAHSRVRRVARELMNCAGDIQSAAFIQADWMHEKGES